MCTQLLPITTVSAWLHPDFLFFFFNRANIPLVLLMFLGLTIYVFPDTKVFQERAGQFEYD